MTPLKKIIFPINLILFPQFAIANNSKEPFAESLPTIVFMNGSFTDPWPEIISFNNDKYSINIELIDSNITDTATEIIIYSPVTNDTDSIKIEKVDDFVYRTKQYYEVKNGVITFAWDNSLIVTYAPSYLGDTIIVADTVFLEHTLSINEKLSIKKINTCNSSFLYNKYNLLGQKMIETPKIAKGLYVKKFYNHSIKKYLFK